MGEASLLRFKHTIIGGPYVRDLFGEFPIIKHKYVIGSFIGDTSGLSVVHKLLWNRMNVERKKSKLVSLRERGTTNQRGNLTLRFEYGARLLNFLHSTGNNWQIRTDVTHTTGYRPDTGMIVMGLGQAMDPAIGTVDFSQVEGLEDGFVIGYVDIPGPIYNNTLAGGQNCMDEYEVIITITELETVNQ